MGIEPFQINPPIAQSAISGIADAQFCQKLLDYGAGMVTLGGFSIDKINIQASKKIKERGRKEFIFPQENENLENWIKQNLILRRKNSKQKIAANVRLVELDELSRTWLSVLDRTVDYIELNAHCRQKEILEQGGGQNIIQNLNSLEQLINSIQTVINPNKLGIKIRGLSIKNIENLTNLLESNQISYIHVDAMVPGVDKSDLNLITKLVSSTSIPIIGNNSVKCIENVLEILELGAVAASLARPLIDSPEIMLELTDQLEGKII